VNLPCPEAIARAGGPDIAFGNTTQEEPSMQGAGYWIDPDGQVKRLPGGRHIDQIIADPARFGFTDTEIRERYAQEH
jgi:hypothetical protein